MAGMFAQPGQCLAVGRLGGVVARADDDSGVPPDWLQALICLNPDPSRTFGRQPIEADDPPTVKWALCQLVGNAKGIDRGTERKKGEARQGQKSEFARADRPGEFAFLTLPRIRAC